MKLDFRKIINYHFLAYFLPVLILFFSFSTYNDTKKRLKERDQQLFEYRISRAVSLINNRINDYFQILKGAQGLFEASDTILRENWHNYVRKLEVSKTFPGIMGIGYSKYLRAREVDSFIEGVRKEGFGGFTIRPEGQRSIYTSIVFLEPFEDKNLRAFGYDMFSEPVRRKAMEIARDSMVATISGKVKLIQESNESYQNGFLAYLPIYKRGSHPKNVEERRRLIQGYVFNPFNINDFINGVLKNGFTDIDVEVFDGDNISTSNLLFNSDSVLNFFNRKSSILYSKSVKLNIGHHIWTIFFSSAPNFGASPADSQPLGILLVGVLISLLVFAVINSFTNVKKYVENLSKAQVLLEEKNDELLKINFDLDNFIYTASHDLKSPIVNLEGLIYNLQKRLDQKLELNDKKVLEMMETSILRLKRTINDLADVTKVQKNINEGIEWINIEEILADVKEDLEILIMDSNATLTEQIEAKHVPFARKNLRSIFYNLISNAIKFRAPSRPLHILVKTEIKEDAVLLTVKDNGLGISKSQQSKLFGMFKRFHKGTEGTGIGLYIVKRIVENNKGIIEVESDEGEGSTFKIYFNNKIKGAESEKSSEVKGNSIEE